MNYEDAVRLRTNIEERIEVCQRSHRRRMDMLHHSLERVSRHIAAANAGLVSVEDCVTAENLMFVRWDDGVQPGGSPGYTRTPEVHRQFANAIRDTEEGFPRMRDHYFGVKSYDGWVSQSVDCEYGFGPSHGYVWFKIGLKQRPGPDWQPTVDDRTACVRWLKAVDSDPEVMLG